MGRALAMCSIAALLFGASTPLAKELLRSAGPFTLAGLLYSGAALAAVLPSRRGGSSELRRNPRQVALLGGAVLLGGVIAPLLFLGGLRAASAASVSLWLNLEILGTVLLAGLMFREHVGVRVWGAAILVLLGGLLLARVESGAGARAAWLVAGACLCWSLDNNLTAKIGGFTPAQITLVKGLVGGTANLTLARAVGETAPGFPIVLNAILVGVACYGISLMLYIESAQKLGASRSQLLFSTAPFFGVALSWGYLGEPVRGTQLVAGGVMAAGAFLLTTSAHSHRHDHAEMFHTHRHAHEDGHHLHVHEGLPAGSSHTHSHAHAAMTHEHAHVPDLHHRHTHAVETSSGRSSPRQ